MPNKLENLKKWASAGREKKEFADSLRMLLYYVSQSIYKKAFPQSAALSPEQAFSQILPFFPSVPLAQFIAFPEKNEAEILKFAAEPPPLPLLGENSAAALSKNFEPQNAVCDLRHVPCPESSARARLFLSGFPKGARLTFLLDEGSPIENVPSALVADGCKLEKREKKINFWEIVVLNQERV